MPLLDTMTGFFDRIADGDIPLLDAPTLLIVGGILVIALLYYLVRRM